MQRRFGLGLLLSAAAALAACGPTVMTENSIVDGWSVGPVDDCLDVAACVALVEAASKALGVRDPGHAPIVTAAYHGEGLYPNGDGDLGQIIRSGAGGFTGVVLFQLADGTYRAIGVGRLPPNLRQTPLTFDEGPGRRPGRTRNEPPAATP